MKVWEKSNKFLLTLFGFQKAKSKAHILLIALIHAAGWCLFFFLPVLFYPVRINDDRFIIRELTDKSVLVALFYLNYYWFIPRLFEKKKYALYASVFVLSFIIYLFQHVIVRANYFPRPGASFQFVKRDLPTNTTENRIRRAAFNKRVFARNGRIIETTDSVDRLMPPFPMQESSLFGVPKGIWAISLNNALSSFVLMMLIGGFARLSYSFIRNQNEKKLLENANLNAEVNFLKSQINPHFLFNTLNSIYSQAHSRSEKTEFSILKLSELLRYMLYDSGENKVELAKDIQYINNYIDLQKIRLSSKVRINYTMNGKPENCKIAPLLLITFIENAFKHGISYTHASTIDIEIHIVEETLTLVVSNPVLEKNNFDAGGLGLKNVTRRLDLLYPGKYLLDIHHNDLLHVVNLKLDLKND